MHKQYTKLLRNTIGWNITELWWKVVWGVKCTVKGGFCSNGHIYVCTYRGTSRLVGTTMRQISLWLHVAT